MFTPNRLRLLFRQGRTLFYCVAREPGKKEMLGKSSLIHYFLLGEVVLSRNAPPVSVLSKSFSQSSSVSSSTSDTSGTTGTGGGDGGQLVCPKCGNPCEYVATLVSSTRLSEARKICILFQ